MEVQNASTPTDDHPLTIFEAAIASEVLEAPADAQPEVSINQVVEVKRLIFLHIFFSFFSF